MEKDKILVGKDELTFRARSDETDGALLAVDVRLPPGGGPPMLHRHAATEIYRVERGELVVLVEDAGGALRRVVATAGDVVGIPGGRAHTVRNESGAGVVAYVVFAPGAEMERFVRAAGALAAPSSADVLALAERHGIEMAGPVPA